MFDSCPQGQRTEKEIKVFYPIQMNLLKSALEIEIKSGVGGMQMTREPALSIYRRLVANQLGLKVGRGIKGRQEALDIVNQILEAINQAKEA